ncbi:MAG: helicase-associated domain-containing protein, partial [Chloroflexi bacterium]|nr:helicase-associated domain-containing protein [Chloroflexota bacterium]
LASTQEARLFASVADDLQRPFQVMVLNEAGDEFSAQCECLQLPVCAHAMALLWAWVHEAHTFEPAAPADAGSAASEPLVSPLKQEWADRLQAIAVKQLRAIARRHQMKLKGNDRASVLTQAIALLADPETPRRALRNLNEAQRCVLQIVFLLSHEGAGAHGHAPLPNARDANERASGIIARQVQRALGWESPQEVDGLLHDLLEWGLVALAPSPWQHYESYIVAPGVAPLIPGGLQIAQTPPGAAFDKPPFDKPRATGVETITKDALAHYRLAGQTLSVPEILFLSRHLGLKTRSTPPPPAHSEANEVLRHWPYVAEELVKLQVRQGWMYRPQSALTVPPRPPYYDDASLARLRALTRNSANGVNDDTLGDFAGHIVAAQPAPVALSLEGRGAGVRVDDAASQNIAAVFDRWRQLSTWTELWLAQRDGALTVRRSVISAPHLPYANWMQQLARARRFILRVLTLPEAGPWYTLESLLKVIHSLQPDFLSGASFLPGGAQSWWLEAHGRKVNGQDFAAWSACDGRFVEELIRGPLCWLGAATVALTPGALRQAQDAGHALFAFQITPLGEALLRNNPPPPSSRKASAVRVHDDLRVDLPVGRTDMSVYAALNEWGQFDSVNNGMAVYRFEAQKAHAAFEAGHTAEDILERLASLSGAPVPARVGDQWREWWAHYGQIRWYRGLTLIEFADDYTLPELLRQTDLREHLLYTFGPRLIAVRPDSADAVARQLVKKGYTPKIE